MALVLCRPTLRVGRAASPTTFPTASSRNAQSPHRGVGVVGHIFHARKRGGKRRRRNAQRIAPRSSMRGSCERGLLKKAVYERHFKRKSEDNREAFKIRLKCSVYERHLKRKSEDSREAFKIRLKCSVYERHFIRKSEHSREAFKIRLKSSVYERHFKRNQNTVERFLKFV